ncbi:PAS domain-containing protein [Methylobacterium sp. J-076]|uniref:PAS domain-containing protein n=1 Tax=Methylobacterium sp. J-076 TaxID=2836655 RepID=UPI00391C01A0
MTALELIRAVAHEAPVSVIVTDAVITSPGPTIVFANGAFEVLVGRQIEDIIGRSPRFMHGKETRRTALDMFRRAFESGTHFHGYLPN